MDAEAAVPMLGATIVMLRIVLLVIVLGPVTCMMPTTREPVAVAVLFMEPAVVPPIVLF